MKCNLFPFFLLFAVGWRRGGDFGSGSGSKFNCAARVGSGQTISGTGRVRASVLSPCRPLVLLSHCLILLWTEQYHISLSLFSFPCFLSFFQSSFLPTCLPLFLPTFLPVLFPSQYFLPTYLQFYLCSLIPAHPETCPPTCYPLFFPLFLPSLLPSLVPSLLPMYLSACLPIFLPVYLPTHLLSYLPTSFFSVSLPTFPHVCLPKQLIFQLANLPNHIPSFPPSFLSFT